MTQRNMHYGATYVHTYIRTVHEWVYSMDRGDSQTQRVLSKHAHTYVCICEYMLWYVHGTVNSRQPESISEISS